LLDYEKTRVFALLKKRNLMPAATPTPAPKTP